MAHLLSRNIFLDTSIIVGKNFGFNAGALSQLKDMSAKGEVKFYLTDITIQEVEKNIAQHIKSAFDELKRFRKKGMILRNIQKTEIAGIFSDLNVEELERESLANFKKYLNDAKAIILKTASVNNEEIFKRYFQAKSPFGHTEDKKYEFPDAFVLTALKDWAHNSKQHIYIASLDQSFKKYCDEFQEMTCLDSAEAFFDLVTTENKRREYLEKLIEAHGDEIVSEVRQKFEDMGFYLQDQEGEVADVEVLNLKISDYLITKIEDEKAHISFPDIEIEYSAYLIYDKLETAMYDSEEKRLIPFERIRKTVKIVQSFDIEIIIEYEFQDEEIFEIEKIAFDLDYDDIAVYESNAETIEVYRDSEDDEE